MKVEPGSSSSFSVKPQSTKAGKEECISDDDEKYQYACDDDDILDFT